MSSASMVTAGCCALAGVEESRPAVITVTAIVKTDSVHLLGSMLLPFIPGFGTRCSQAYTNLSLTPEVETCARSGASAFKTKRHRAKPRCGGYSAIADETFVCLPQRSSVRGNNRQRSRHFVVPAVPNKSKSGHKQGA